MDRFPYIKANAALVSQHAEALRAEVPTNPQK